MIFRIVLLLTVVAVVKLKLLFRLLLSFSVHIPDLLLVMCCRSIDFPFKTSNYRIYIYTLSVPLRTTPEYIYKENTRHCRESRTNNTLRTTKIIFRLAYCLTLDFALNGNRSPHSVVPSLIPIPFRNCLVA